MHTSAHITVHSIWQLKQDRTQLGLEHAAPSSRAPLEERREKWGGEGRDHMHRRRAGDSASQASSPPSLLLSLLFSPLHWWTQVDIQTLKCRSVSHWCCTETSALVCLEKLSAHSLTINQSASTPASEPKWNITAKKKTIMLPITRCVARSRWPHQRSSALMCLWLFTTGVAKDAACVCARATWSHEH